MNDNYANRQAERDQRYRDAWESPETLAWIASLTPEERGRLEADGLLAPMLAKEASGGCCGLEDDVADCPGAIVEAPRISASDSLEAILADYPHLEQAIEERARRMNGPASRSDVLASFCAHIRGCSKPVLAFDAICYATGVSALEGESGTDLAAKHGVTKQAFSKIAVEWCETFGLQPSRSMKSKRARAAYRHRAKAVHQRHKLTSH